MTEGRIRTALALFIVASHFGAIILVLGLFFVHGFLFEEMTTTLAIVVPMFASYTTAIVRYIIKHRHSPRSQRIVTLEFALLAFSLPLIFVLCVFAMIVAKGFSLAFQNFDQFKTLLAVLESLFGLYVGYFATELFDHGAKNRASRQIADQ